MAVRIIEQDGDAVEAEVMIGDVVLSVITRVQWMADRIVLYDLHVSGPGANRLGVAALRKAVDEVMEIYGVARVEIRGFRRTTGAGAGRVPGPVRFDRRDG